MKSNFKRVKFVHSEVDKYLDILLKDRFVSSVITCKKGCTACCHTQVSITEDEAIFLAQRAVDENLFIDMKNLYLQASVLNSDSKWYGLPYEKRRCIFLDDNNLCKVYEDRPLVCRTNYVLSPKESCLTLDGKERPLRLLNTPRADMITVGAFTQSKENGALPYMIWKAFKKIK